MFATGGGKYPSKYIDGNEIEVDFLFSFSSKKSLVSFAGRVVVSFMC